jgi:hypothetical protein
MKKKLLAIIVATVMTCGMLIGCGNSSPKNTPSEPVKTTDTANNNTNAVKDPLNLGTDNTNTTKGNTNTNTANNNNNTTNNNNNNNNNNNYNNAPKNTSVPYNNQQKVIQVPVTIINGTDIKFAKLYASSINVDNWGNNILSNGVNFGPGNAVIATFGVDANNLRWDFKAVDYYGDSLEFNGLDLSKCNANGITITLTYNRQTHTGRITAK